MNAGGVPLSFFYENQSISRKRGERLLRKCTAYARYFCE
jgi:hypothetical protein